MTHATPATAASPRTRASFRPPPALRRLLVEVFEGDSKSMRREGHHLSLLHLLLHPLFTSEPASDTQHGHSHPVGKTHFDIGARITRSLGIRSGVVEDVLLRMVAAEVADIQR